MALHDDARTRTGANEWMQQPAVRQRPDPAPGVFEVALSLGGTVSAGAYTAGVLDFLVEALDQWDTARRDDSTPQHRVVLQALSGTSGGGACAATLAKALAHAFTPERITQQDAPPNAASKNPLYRSWVLGFDLEQMCRVPEASHAPLTALLHPGPRAHPIDLPAGERRAWVADPLTVIVTLTNLTGVPFRVAYMGDATHGQGYTRHDDYARLEFFYRTASASALCWPDATRVQAHPDADARGHPASIEASWDEAWTLVRATSAFPVAFPVIELERPAWHYLYQPIVTPRPDGRGGVALDAAVLQPAWADRG
ncbi:MAG: patatin-like phospholipase family protein, partial [Burkholderiaceae bacterium]